MSEKREHLQLSISRVQFCSSNGYLLRSIMQAAVVVILETHTHTHKGYRKIEATILYIQVLTALLQYYSMYHTCSTTLQNFCVYLCKQDEQDGTN